MPRYILQGPYASDYDADCTTAPSRIPPRALLAEETQALFEGGHGTTPDLIYAGGVPDTPDPGHAIFDKKACTPFFLEIGFSRDLGCDKNHTEKTEKFSPLVTALKQDWGWVEFVAIPIGHAGKTLTKTLDHLTAAFSTVRPRKNHTTSSKCTSLPITDYNARSHGCL